MKKKQHHKKERTDLYAWPLSGKIYIYLLSLAFWSEWKSWPIPKRNILRHTMRLHSNALSVPIECCLRSKHQSKRNETKDKNRLGAFASAPCFTPHSPLIHFQSGVNEQLQFYLNTRTRTCNSHHNSQHHQFDRFVFFFSVFSLLFMFRPHKCSLTH